MGLIEVINEYWQVFTGFIIFILLLGKMWGRLDGHDKDFQLHAKQIETLFNLINHHKDRRKDV